jgi:MinD superfamily P-loop ATPase
MKVAVASGKGGTGKTLIAISLALSLEDVQLLDCDVEEPNDHIFIKPTELESEPVTLGVPKILEDKCDYCGACSEFCQYNALFVVGETAMVFPELCHSCGGCTIVCPRDAIIEEPREIGRIIKGRGEGIELIYGELNIGEPMAVPIISAVKKEGRDNGTIIIDSPPGSACPVVEAVHGSDYCILVTEPTPFGLHDLEVAVEVIEQMEIPMGVVVNFAGIGDREVYDFCLKKDIPILLEIPFDRRIAELYSRGIPYVKEMPEWMDRYRVLYKRIEELI